LGNEKSRSDSDEHIIGVHASVARTIKSHSWCELGDVRSQRL